ncbi:MAG: hypothetical protein LQ343_004180 [Gyalolechia ehrenbergii]|nr:MAG: hypothetical protein LQ343_004180 [Gyalolechia ehrenbergii]
MAESNKTRWSEAEKVALLVSLLAASGPPNWKNVQLPAGRSRMACQHVYMAAVKEAQGVAVGDNKNADAVKKRERKKATTSKAKAGSKRKDDEKDKSASEVSDYDAHKLKKVKADVESDEERGIKREVDEV